MSQLQTAAPPNAEPMSSLRVQPAGAIGRSWIPKIAILVAMAIGFIAANTLPAVSLADGGVPLSDVAAIITKEGNGWVMTLVWMAGVIAAIAVLAFPIEERFIQTVAISLGSLAVLILPIYISQNLAKIEPHSVGLGPGMLGLAGGFLVAAVLPWLNLLWWNRMSPVLGPAWEKWLFIGPAAFWILALTVFPLAYAVTTSRYAFRTGKIVKDVGWGNYRKLFNDVMFDPGTRSQAIIHTVLVVIIAVVAVLAIGAVVGLLLDQGGLRQGVRNATKWVPLVVVPALILSLTGEPSVLPSFFGQPLPTFNIFEKDVSFTLSITYIFVVGAVVLEMILGFLLALFFNREMRGRSVLRTIITLPIFATPVAIGFLGRTIFYEGGGPVNSFLQLFGVTPPPWLSSPTWARVTTIITDVWEWTPLVFIIALAGLQGLPQDVTEASAVDGAGWWATLRYITLPLMAPILWLILLLRTVDAFKVFDLVVAMTLGGPGQATRYYSFFNYQTARKQFFYGEAAAQAFLLLIIVLILVSLLWGRIRHIYEDQEAAA
ncbi:MAG: sugar ABC transporter permease [Chloroflexia bacterium]|nr:sugar ABC transporter permease [Chloroflexia bacterium]